MFTIQAEPLLADRVDGQHGLDFGDGVGLPYLEIRELGVGVGNQIIDQFVEQRGRAGGLDLRLLAEHVAVAGDHEIAQLRQDAATALAVFILAIGQDAFERCRGGAGLGTVDVLFDLQVEGQLDVEPFAFGGPD